MKLLNFIKKNVLLVAAFATVIGFSAFKVVESNSQTMVTFVYQAPLADPSNPYSETNVKNHSNWIKSDELCSLDEEQEVACSIQVPLSKTMNGGTQIDPTQVTIETFEHNTNNYGVTPSSSGDYDDPINKPLFHN